MCFPIDLPKTHFWVAFRDCFVELLPHTWKPKQKAAKQIATQSGIRLNAGSSEKTRSFAAAADQTVTVLLFVGVVLQFDIKRMHRECYKCV